jgi:hypothetical protein
MKKWLQTRLRKNSKGQSFVELALLLGVLLFLLLGVVEFGYLLNQYITLVEGTRAAARFGSTGDPFTYDPMTGAITGNDLTNFYGKIATFVVGSETNLGSIEPLELVPANHDDVVISVISIAGGNITRFPDADGWSLNNQQASRFSRDDIEDLLDTSAPNTGMLLIEVFYHYEQLLGLEIPLISGDAGVIPNPIPVHAYSIMPLTAAEPTPTP